MNAWWTRIDGEVKKHDGRGPKVWALFAIKVAVTSMGVKPEACSLYKRDPAKFPDEPDVLPAIIEKERQREMARQIRAIMRRDGGGKRKS